jgi:hypothetical protein
MNGEIIEKNGVQYQVKRIWVPWSENDSGNIIMGHEEVTLIPIKKENVSSNIRKDLRNKTKAEIISFYKNQGGEENLSSLTKNDLLDIVVKHAKMVLGENNSNNNNNNNNNNSYYNNTEGGKRKRRVTRRRKH